MMRPIITTTLEAVVALASLAALWGAMWIGYGLGLD